MGEPGSVRSLATTPCAEILAALAARTPTPGGGAACALAAALGCATGAMAARYTTGPKWPDRSEAAAAIATGLDEVGRELLALADEDAAAFAAVTASRKAQDAVALGRAEARSAQIPAEVLEHCLRQALLLDGFRALCNPRLVSDVEVGIALLAGAGRGALATLLANPLSAEARSQALAQLHALEALTAQPPRVAAP